MEWMRGAGAPAATSASRSRRAAEDLPLPGRPRSTTAMRLGRLARPGCPMIACIGVTLAGAGGRLSGERSGAACSRAARDARHCSVSFIQAFFIAPFMQIKHAAAVNEGLSNAGKHCKPAQAAGVLGWHPRPACGRC